MTNDSATTVLVTGATGHVGSHSVERLLAEGYRVRVVVRHDAQEQDVRAFAGPSDRLEFVTAELTADDNWDKAVAGVRYVWHHASPFPSTPPQNDDEVIVPARDGALRVLAAAGAANVRRVVLTSSYAAVGYSPKPGDHYDESDWTNPDDDLPAYIRSKVIAERAAWQYAREHAGAELTVINPTGIFGPLLTDRLSASTGLVKALLEGVALPPQVFGVVDVRDVADLHLRAMLSPAAAGERFIGVAGPPISFAEMGQILARHLRDLAGRVPAAEPTGDRGSRPVISNAKAREVLGWRPREVATTIADTADSLLRLGLVRSV
ncbi:aldehyde reductase [Actinoplanes sp. Pm04-4]|uniref:Aldehyde reductase n=1 Tax=Paractinoplanes pyxinae TaxID=2997416 RepID=A0ABT4AYM5_9ACTN|nr:aldehyde reductase [Actinoplanes pyxinae]MCY1138957.1 aldehyde reductase [Actinoplanes pyxinae]